MADYSDQKIRKIDYYNEMLLTEDELKTEQFYHIKMRQIENIYFHGWGILTGLEVSLNDDDQIVIKKGMAFKRYINEDNDLLVKEIVLIEDKDPFNIEETDNFTISEGEYFIIIDSEEILEESDPLKGDEKLYIVDKIKFSILSTDENIDDNEIILAKIIIDNNKKIVEIHSSCRCYCGIDIQGTRINRLNFTDNAPGFKEFNRIGAIECEDSEEMQEVVTIKANFIEMNGIEDINNGITSLNLKGNLNIEGNLIINNGNLEINNTVLNTELYSGQLYIKDNRITINPDGQNGSPGKYEDAGFEVHDSDTSGDGKKASIKFIEDKGWIVNDGNGKEGKLTIGLPPEILTNEDSDDHHYHSVLKNRTGDIVLKVNDDKKTIIGTPGTDPDYRLFVEGWIKLLNYGRIVFPGGNIQGPLKSLFFTYVFEPVYHPAEDTGNSEKLNDILQNITENAVVFIAIPTDEEGNKYNNVYFEDTIYLINNKNIKLICAEQTFIYTNSGFDNYFEIINNCENIVFENFNICSSPGFIKIPGDIEISGLKIINCTNINRYTGEDYGSLIIAGENTAGSGGLIKNTIIQNCSWQSTIPVIDILSFQVIDFIMRDNNFTCNTDEEAAVIIKANDLKNMKITGNCFQTNCSVLYAASTSAENDNKLDIENNNFNIISEYEIENYFEIISINNVLICQNIILLEMQQPGPAFYLLKLGKIKNLMVTNNYLTTNFDSDNHYSLSIADIDDYSIRNNIFSCEFDGISHEDNLKIKVER